MPNPVLEVQIETHAYGGECLARAADGRRVFVRGALPGEQVRVQVTEERPSYLRARTVEVLRPSETRGTPRCAHYGECGGCHLQHMHYAAQLAAKSDVLREQLRRLGGVEAPPLQEAIASPAEWNYRNHVQFSLAADGRLGYMRQGSRHVLAIRECHLPEPLLDEIWPALDMREAQGITQVGLRADSEGETMVMLEGSEAGMPEVQVERSLSVVWLAPGGRSDTLVGEDALHFAVSGQNYRVSPASFFQVNTGLLPTLVEQVLALVEVGAGDTALDVYSGVGLFSAFLARRARRVVAVEASPSAAADFEDNLASFDNVELYEATAAAVLPHLEIRPQVAVVDPPRAGLDREAMAGLVGLAPRRIVYVSCDPSTLARDARALQAAGYSLATLIPIDLFPQTYHIESISLWRAT
ncbi:MAG: class I SAM-dependent RNA methyltransferase [Chloroflexi bacterium]|nr:class I SAM-dependent RNA methyltransferase [Chloroflexota bacterium]